MHRFIYKQIIRRQCLIEFLVFEQHAQIEWVICTHHINMLYQINDIGYSRIFDKYGDSKDM